MSKSSLTLKGLKDYAGESIAKLVCPVYNQLGSDNVESFFSTCKDITGHGAACGFSGFIYYSDTIAFYRKYKTEIKPQAKKFTMKKNPPKELRLSELMRKESY